MLAGYGNVYAVIGIITGGILGFGHSTCEWHYTLKQRD